MILSEVPRPAGTGAEVRAWHFIQSIVKLVEESTICILTDSGAGSIDAASLPGVHKVIQPESGFTNGRNGRFITRFASFRRFLVLAMPWRDCGWHLMIAGRANNVEQTAKASWSRLVYGFLLRKLAFISGRFALIYPPGLLVRWDVWCCVRDRSIAHLRKSPPDVIWCEHSYMYPGALELKAAFPDAKIYCNAHNVESALHKSMASIAQTESARNWIMTEAYIVEFWERRMVRDAERIVCCSEADRERFSQMSLGETSNLSVIPNGVDVTFFKPSPCSKPKPTILFAGTAGYLPNDDAVDWFGRSIFPLVRQAIPDCEWIIAGRGASKHWSQWASIHGGIRVESDVPDMRDYFSQTTLCIVPLRSGSGTRLKILEALGCGRTMVTTSIGAEGIDGIDGVHWKVAGTAEEFAAAVVLLLRDEEQRLRMELAGRGLVCERYSWKFLMREIPQLFHL